MRSLPPFCALPCPPPVCLLPTTPNLFHQVKLQGQRLELGEIESVITAHDDVDLAVVKLIKPHPNEPEYDFLVAYLVVKPASGRVAAPEAPAPAAPAAPAAVQVSIDPEPGRRTTGQAVAQYVRGMKGQQPLADALDSPDVALGMLEADLEREVRAECRAYLPRFMVPYAFVQCQRMPQTLSGKINRLAIPPPPQALLMRLLARARADGPGPGAAAGPDAAAAAAAAEDPNELPGGGRVAEALTAMVRRLKRLEEGAEVDRAMPLRELGVNSMQLTHLVNQVCGCRGPGAGGALGKRCAGPFVRAHISCCPFVGTGLWTGPGLTDVAWRVTDGGLG